MSEIHITDLTEFQLSKLNYAGVADIPGFLQQQANETDTAEDIALIVSQQREVAQLVALGLVEDISERWTFTQPGRFIRNFSVYGLTDIGMLMFRKAEFPSTVN